MSSRIMDFINSIGNGDGNAKPDRFFSQFTLPGLLAPLNATASRDLTYRCHTSELPGVTLHTNTYKTYGIAKTQPVAKLYNEITFSFYCTNAFTEKPLFDSWIEYINPANLGYDFRYADEYVTTIDVCQLNLTSDIPVYTARLLRAYPISVYPMVLNWGATNEIHSLRVTFVYQKYVGISTVSVMNDILQSMFSNVAPTTSIPGFSNLINTPSTPLLL